MFVPSDAQPKRFLWRRGEEDEAMNTTKVALRGGGGVPEGIDHFPFPVFVLIGFFIVSQILSYASPIYVNKFHCVQEFL